MQAYTRDIVGPDGIPPPAPVEKTLAEWEYFPPAAAIGVRAAWELSNHTPVMVTENGIAMADDSRRIDYTRAALIDLHVKSLHLASRTTQGFLRRVRTKFSHGVAVFTRGLFRVRACVSKRACGSN